jgi:addiction module HigA family antidote
MKYKTLEDIEAAKFLISHPGETLIDTIDAKNISQTELASRMGRPIKTINEIIQGKTAITPETAIQLERVLGISAEFWIEREQNYRLELAEIAETETLLEKSQWLINFPLLSMKKLGWIDYSKNEIIEQFNAVLSFFSVSSVDAYHNHYEIEEAEVAFRMINTGDKNKHNVNAWLRKGAIQANELPTIEFDATKFKSALDNVKTIMSNHPDNFFQQLQSLCLHAGVKVVHTPCLPKTMLHGSTRWINNTAIIQLSNQYKRNDIFWFTFFHEAGHILKHGKKDVFVEGLDYTAEGLKKEEEANEFASKYTFSAKEEKTLMTEIVNQTDQVAYINSYANKIKTHPAQIIGQLARKKILHPSVGWTHGFYKKVDLSN